MKYVGKLHGLLIGQSLSSRRAWIEIAFELVRLKAVQSLSSRRAWIEMFQPVGIEYKVEGRSPHGERGLKFLLMLRIFIRSAVALLTESVD